MAQLRHVEPGKLRSELRGDLDWIVMKALEKDRNRRYETAHGLPQAAVSLGGSVTMLFSGIISDTGT